jgi:hypothetical protein
VARLPVARPQVASRRAVRPPVARLPVAHLLVAHLPVAHLPFVHLIEVAQNPKVKVLVVPDSAGAHVGLSGAFVIAGFRDAPEMVYLDTAAQGQIADHPDIVKACIQIFGTLRAEALPPRASLELITEVRQTWT